MSEASGHTFRDQHDQAMRIEPSVDHEATAWLNNLTPNAVVVPAHRLAEFTRALYAAAGQAIPDHPVICDPVMVQVLTDDLAGALPETQPAIWLPTVAAKLLDAGWRKP